MQAAPSISPDRLEPPVVKGLPLLGNSIQAYKNIVGLMVDSYQTYGPIFIMNRFGKSSVVLAGRRANEFYAENETLFYSGGVYHTMSREAGTDYLFNSMDGVEHKHLRRESGPAFSRQIIANAIPAVVSDVMQHARQWPSGTVFEAMREFGALTARQAGRLMLNHTMSESEESALARFAGTFVGAGVNIYPSFMVALPGYRKAKAQFFGMMRRVLTLQRELKEREGKPASFVSAMLQASRFEGVPLTDDDLVACVSFPFVMNEVYTNRVISYLMYELIRNPIAFDRVQTEIDAVILQGDFSVMSLQRMTYLRSAIKEALRLYPLIIGLPRHAKSDFEFDGYTVKKGQKVIFASAVTHFLPEFFPDPWSFDINRFVESGSDARKQRLMLPFGLGQHACLGSNVAELLMLATVTGLLGPVKFELADPAHRVKRVARPLPGPEGLKLRVRPRTSADERHKEAHLKHAEVVLDEAADSIPESSKSSLLEQFTTVSAEPGSLVFRKGDRGTDFFVVMKGELEVLSDDGSSAEKEIISEGYGFGADELLTDARRTASVRVRDPDGAELLALNAAAFREFVGSYDLTAVEIAALAHKRSIARGLAEAMPLLTPKLIVQKIPECETLTMAPHELIIRQGDEAAHFYIVLKGDVEVFQESPDGGRRNVARLKTSEYFGEIGLLEKRRRTATVQAGADGALLISLTRASFLNLMKSSDQTESSMARTAVRRLVELAANV
jgi:cytochrome P450/CRP-like cAMP-binding protein